MLIKDTSDMLKIVDLASAEASARGLVDDAAIFDRLATLQSKKGTDFSPVERQELNRITNSLMKKVGPEFVDQIQRDQSYPPSKRSIYSRFGKAFSGLRQAHSVQGSIFAICIALIIVIIPLTTSFNRLTVSIAELREVEQQDFFFVVYQARAATKDKAQSAQDLQKELKKLRELRSKINASNLAIASTVDLSTGAPKWFAVMLASYGFASPPGVRLASAAEAIPVTPAKSCAAEDEVCLNEVFTNAYGLSIGTDDVSAAYFNRRQAESAVALLGGSVLPVLYGLLGASVYLLRRYLGQSNLEMDSNFGMRAYLRLGLGGIAGLAIGWFWTPSSAKAAMDVVTLTTAPFALAFLGGFSIELLFSILDRILAAVNPSTSARDVDAVKTSAP